MSADELRARVAELEQANRLLTIFVVATQLIILLRALVVSP